MGYPTRVQLIRRKDSQQWYINFPLACAQLMHFQKGEIVEWELTPQGDLLLRRQQPSNPKSHARKTR